MATFLLLLSVLSSFLLEEGISINATNSVTFLDGAHCAPGGGGGGGGGEKRVNGAASGQQLTAAVCRTLLRLCGTYLRTLDSWL